MSFKCVKRLKKFVLNHSARPRIQIFAPYRKTIADQSFSVSIGIKRLLKFPARIPRHFQAPRSIRNIWRVPYARTGRIRWPDRFLFRGSSLFHRRRSRIEIYVDRRFTENVSGNSSKGQCHFYVVSENESVKRK